MKVFNLAEELEKERKKNKKLENKIEQLEKYTEVKEQECDDLQDKVFELEEKYNKALELLADFNMPCEVYEGKIPNEYCEEHCEVGDEIYKKCWNKYIELELKGDNK